MPTTLAPALNHPIRRRARRCVVVFGWMAVSLAAPVHAQDGLHRPTSLRLASPAGGLWVRGQAFGDTTPAESANLGRNATAWRLLGSYDLPRAGGLRASGGMIGVSRRTALGAAALRESHRWDAGLTHGWIDDARNSQALAQAPNISVPYVGLSYTATGSAASSRGLVASSWSFNIDLGVMALAPRSAVRLGAAPSTQDRLDDLLRELRLAPLLQLGVSYSF